MMDDFVAEMAAAVGFLLGLMFIPFVRGFLRGWAEAWDEVERVRHGT